MAAVVAAVAAEIVVAAEAAVADGAAVADVILLSDPFFLICRSESSSRCRGKPHRMGTIVVSLLYLLLRRESEWN